MNDQGWLRRLVFVFVISATGFQLTGAYADEAEAAATAEASQLSEKAAEAVKGLRAAKDEELQGKQIMLDGESLPVYDIEGKRIRSMEMMQAIVSGEFVPQPYVDEESEIKAFVLREATAEEKSRMSQMQTQMGDDEPLVGERAERFKVTDRDGNVFDSDQLKGKVVVVNFWFIACKPCVMEMPELNELVEKYEDQEVVFLAMTHDSQKSVADFLEKKDFSYHVVPDAADVIQAYGVTGFPTSLVIDTEGVIAAATTGYSPRTKATLDAKIGELLGGE